MNAQTQALYPLTFEVRDAKDPTREIDPLRDLPVGVFFCKKTGRFFGTPGSFDVDMRYTMDLLRAQAGGADAR